MAQPARSDPRTTSREYAAMVREGVLGPGDRAELLEGVIVAMSPQNPEHASATQRSADALRDAIGRRALVSVQAPLVLGPYSTPEPDVAVIPGSRADYDRFHPTTALLIVEVADSSLVQDRLTKSALYAASGIPEYWIVNLRDDQIEVLRNPVPGGKRYGEARTARRGESLALSSLPGCGAIRVDDLLPLPAET